MKQLQKLHESFIEKAHRPMTLGGLPIMAREPKIPIVAMERWREAGGALHKTYRFRRLADRNQFVTQLLAYESATEHSADVHVSSDQVSIKVQTHDLGKVTELDKEYARYADILFKGLVYSPSDEVP